MATKSHWAPLALSQAPIEDEYWLQVTTDIPCHLFMRWTLTEPLTHPTELIRRGISLPYATRWCFVNMHENEQLEPGDTLVHTFRKSNWPVCQTRWFYFVGTIAGDDSPSSSCIFHVHHEPPPATTEMKILAEYASRTLLSTHGAWATCWNGANLEIYFSRQAPNFFLHADSYYTVSYWIRRGHLSFYIPQLPPGATLLSAKLGIHVLTHSATAVPLYINEGIQSEPVGTTDWLPQNAYDTIFGEVSIPALVDNQYNEIPLNAAGLSWITKAMTRSHQYESYDSDQNVHGLFYAPYRYAQGFTPDQNHQLRSLRLMLKKYAGTPATVYVDIYEADANGKPTGPILASGSTPGNTLSTATWGDWRIIDLGSGCALTANQMYCIVIYSPGSNAGNCPSWSMDGATNYINGDHWQSNDAGVTWTVHYPNRTGLFITYNHLLKGARRLVLRTAYDTNNVVPPGGAPAIVSFYHSQKGIDYAPYLEITYKPPL